MNPPGRPSVPAAALAPAFGAAPGRQAVATALLDSLAGPAAVLDARAVIPAVNTWWRRSGISEAAPVPLLTQRAGGRVCVLHQRDVTPAPALAQAAEDHAAQSRDVAEHGGGAVVETTTREAARREAGETILLAEDQEAVRVLARLILEQHGYRVHVASDGADGLAVAGSLPAFDLLVTDVVMPNLSGPQLAAQLAERRPGLRVLFMSGYVGEPSSTGAAVPPGAPLLSKPFTPAALLEAVRRVLDGPGQV